jgi:hypothetical protein
MSIFGFLRIIDQVERASPLEPPLPPEEPPLPPVVAGRFWWLLAGRGAKAVPLSDDPVGVGHFWWSSAGHGAVALPNTPLLQPTAPAVAGHFWWSSAGHGAVPVVL